MIPWNVMSEVLQQNIYWLTLKLQTTLLGKCVYPADFSISVTFTLNNMNTLIHSLSFSSKLLPWSQDTTGSDEAILFRNVMATSSFLSLKLQIVYIPFPVH